jgi:hypothetical protein
MDFDTQRAIDPVAQVSTAAVVSDSACGDTFIGFSVRFYRALDIRFDHANVAQRSRDVQLARLVSADDFALDFGGAVALFEPIVGIA